MCVWGGRSDVGTKFFGALEILYSPPHLDPLWGRTPVTRSTLAADHEDWCLATPMTHEIAELRLQR